MKLRGVKSFPLGMVRMGRMGPEGEQTRLRCCATRSCTSTSTSKPFSAAGRGLHLHQRGFPSVPFSTKAPLTLRAPTTHRLPQRVQHGPRQLQIHQQPQHIPEETEGLGQ